MELIKTILMILGIGWILETISARYGWWLGIHWGSKTNKHPGWWKFRYLPRKTEYRRIRKDVAS